MSFIAGIREFFTHERQFPLGRRERELCYLALKGMSDTLIRGSKYSKEFDGQMDQQAIKELQGEIGVLAAELGSWIERDQKT